jgi:hypothetical protein
MNYYFKYIAFAGRTAQTIALCLEEIRFCTVLQLAQNENLEQNGATCAKFLAISSSAINHGRE